MNLTVRTSCSIGVMATVTLVVLTSLFLLMKPSHAQAKAQKYALLIGINNYQDAHLNPLRGTHNDVESMAEVLSDWNFPTTQVVKLLDGQATKSNIMKEIDKLTQQAKQDDQVFIYYSGHGTSLYDKTLSKLQVDLPINSGAIVPYDAVTKGPSLKIKNSLIEKYADLLPRWDKFENKGVNVFVMFDSCYSQNAARSVQAAGNNNFSNSYKTIALDFDDDELFEDNNAKSSIESQAALQIMQAVETGHKDFKHILFFSAAGKHEKAIDINHNSEQLCPFNQATGSRQCVTYDGKEHGAFSDQFFSLMLGKRSVSAINTNTLTYADLIDNIQQGMGQTPFRHTPLAMPEKGASRLALLNQAVFGEESPSKQVKFAKTLTRAIYSKDLPAKVKDYIKKSQAFELTTDFRYDYRFSFEKSAMLVKSPAREILAVRKKDKSEVAMMIDYLEWENWISHLPTQAKANFAVDLTLSEKGIGSRVPMGTSLNFNPIASKNVFAVVLGLLATGEIVTLYPNKKEKGKRINDPGALSSDPLTACGLPGKDNLLMLGFDTPSPAVNWNWDGQSDISRKELEQTLAVYKGKVAMKLFPLATYKTTLKSQLLAEQVSCDD